jgi:hypothetical protein
MEEAEAAHDFQALLFKQKDGKLTPNENQALSQALSSDGSAGKSMVSKIADYEQNLVTIEAHAKHATQADLYMQSVYQQKNPNKIPADLKKSFDLVATPVQKQELESAISWWTDTQAMEKGNYLSWAEATAWKDAQLQAGMGGTIKGAKESFWAQVKTLKAQAKATIDELEDYGPGTIGAHVLSKSTYGPLNDLNLDKLKALKNEIHDMTNSMFEDLPHTGSLADEYIKDALAHGHKITNPYSDQKYLWALENKDQLQAFMKKVNELTPDEKDGLMEAWNKAKKEGLDITMDQVLITAKGIMKVSQTALQNEVDSLIDYAIKHGSMTPESSKILKGTPLAKQKEALDQIKAQIDASELDYKIKYDALATGEDWEVALAVFPETSYPYTAVEWNNLPHKTKYDLMIKDIEIKKAAEVAEKNAIADMPTIIDTPKTPVMKKSALFKDLESHLVKSLDEMGFGLPNYKSHLTEYKKAIIQGKKPTKSQLKAFDNLQPSSQKVLEKEIHQVMKEMGKEVPLKPAVVPAVSETVPMQFSDFVKYAEKEGSNEGGFYHHKDNPGEKFYFKFPKSEDIAHNEILAGKLYELAGVDVPELVPVYRNGKMGVASRIKDGVKKDPDALTSGHYSADIEENFVVDAWLGDWDVVGMGYDNMQMRGNRAIRIDVGGSLRYRAQGGIKSANDWNETVYELESMRNASTNPYAAAVFKNVTKEQMETGARKVLAVSDESIRDMVRKFGPEGAADQQALIDILIARKNYIKDRFPNAATVLKKTGAPPPTDYVTAQEIRAIEDSRVNGYVIRTDKDQIEDMEVLFVHEVNTHGENLTVGNLKLRGAAATKMDKLSITSSASVLDTASTHLDASEVGEDMYQAMRGISKQARSGLPLRTVDLERASAAWKRYNTTHSLIEDMIKDGRLTPADLAGFEKAHEHWLPHIEYIGKLGAPEHYTFPDQHLGGGDLMALRPSHKMKFIATTGTTPVPPPVEDWVWTTKTGHGEAKTTKNGYVTRTDNPLSFSVQSKYIEGKKGDAIVRYWYGTNVNTLAIKNRMEIIVKGKPVTGAEDIQKILTDLGINGKRATAEYQEELYLSQLIYQSNDPTRYKIIMAELKTHKAESQRIDFLLKEYEKITGIADIRTSPDYNPFGSKQAWDQGRQFMTRPDLIMDPQWEQFKKDYILWHDCNYGGRVPMKERLRGILNGGGQMAPTTDKLRRGFSPSGKSPQSDMESGGASYFFTRIYKRDEINRATASHYRRAAGTMEWNADALKRADSVSYPQDYYGDVGPSVLHNGRGGRGGRTNTIEGFKSYSKGREDNETIFKNSLSIFDGMDAMYVEKEDLVEIVQMFRDALKSDKWPDGRLITEVILPGV